MRENDMTQVGIQSESKGALDGILEENSLAGIGYDGDAVLKRGKKHPDIRIANI